MPEKGLLFLFGNNALRGVEIGYWASTAARLLKSIPAFMLYGSVYALGL